MNNALLDLVTYAFHKTPTGGRQAFEHLLTFSDSFTHESEGQLTSMVLGSRFDVFWHDRVLKMTGVGYVASYPEYRGNGAASQLMRELLEKSYKDGVALSYLAPFSYQFYGRFGYQYAFNQKRYSLSIQDFPKGQQTDKLVQRLASYESLQPIFERANNHGSIKRSQAQWQYFFSLKKQAYFARYEDKGYVIYGFEGMDLIIHELIALDYEAKQALYRFISSHAGAFERVIWLAPSTTQFEADVLEPNRLTIELMPYMMARIVNVAAFLEANPLDFRVQVTDDLLPANNGIYGQGDRLEQMTIEDLTNYVFNQKTAILRDYF